jgi:glycine dehydrogenase subunit 1
VEDLLGRLGRWGLLGGLPLPGNRLLWCATEMNTRDQMDRLLETAGEATHG